MLYLGRLGRSLQSLIGTEAGTQGTRRVARRASAATSAVKVKQNMNLLLNRVGNLMKDTEVLNSFLTLVFSGKVCHPELSGRI